MCADPDPTPSARENGDIVTDTRPATPAALHPAPSPAQVAQQARARTPVEVTGAQSLVLSLEAMEVDTVFGIPGGAILPAYDPLLDSVKVRHILVRHEQGAGHAAEGYASATGKVGVCMATSGPGATNLVTALADAYPSAACPAPCSCRTRMCRTLTESSSGS